MQKEEGLPSGGSRKTAGKKDKTARAERLDKILAQEGLGTRSEIKKAIRSGKALVNGQVEKDAGRQVLPSDEILFQGRKIERERFVYYMLNKPAGVITATEDRRQKTVLDLLREPELEQEPRRGQGSGNGGLQPERKLEAMENDLFQRSVPAPVLRRDLFPVGRLDKDTEGLLVITDDGQLAHRLLAPGKHVDKIYYAVVTGQVTEEDVRKFEQGLRIDDSLTAMPARLQVIAADQPAQQELSGGQTDLSGLLPDRADLSGLLPDRTDLNGLLPDRAALRELLPAQEVLREFFPQNTADITEYTQTFVTIREGKFHQIKRMFAAIGKEVLYLKRLSMGTLWLDPSLAPGQFRKLTEEEIEAL